MNIEEKLNQRVEILQKRIHKIKKETISSEDYLHSGELSLIKFIDRYNRKTGENPTLVKLSSIIDVSQATITSLADRLIKKGLIIKELNKEDKRAKVVFLTDKGKDLLLINQKRHLEDIKEIVDLIGEKDSEELVKILDKINMYFENKIKESKKL